MNFNEIFMRRRNKILDSELHTNGVLSPDRTKACIVAMIKNLESYGYTLSAETITKLSNTSEECVKKCYAIIIENVKALTGADRTYNVMYPNFPEQVYEMDDIELFFNAIIHYISDGQLMPKYKKDERFPLIDNVKLKSINFGTRDELMEIFINLVSSKTSLSEQDKNDVTYFIKNVADYYKYLPDEIPLKENVAFVSKTILDVATDKNVKHIAKYFNTATDVLRFITALSEGDISLATNTKYKKLKRKERRMVMDLLSECGNITEDLFRYRYEWVRIGEIVHPAEYKSAKYLKVNDAFKTLRNDKKPKFFGGNVQLAIAYGQIAEAVSLLKNRPGEFARQLDKLMRDASNPVEVIKAFAEVADSVSTPVLLQVRQHFLDRTTSDNVRVFFPKGSTAKIWVTNNTLPSIEPKYCMEIVSTCNAALIKNYRDREPMKAVYIDDDFKKFFVPFSQRSASSGTKTMVRGSRFAISADTKIVRGFIWWTNTEHDRVDLDLSVVAYDKNWNLIARITYYDLRSETYFKGCHSGDIVNGGNVNGDGVAEFIDIDLGTIKTNKIKYIAFSVNSFTGQRFDTLPNARFGFMQRQAVDSGEIFEPKTVETSIDLTTSTTIEMPMILDCETREFIWCDLAVKGNKIINNVDMNLTQTTAACRAIVNMSKPTMYDVIALNAEARGYLVNDRNKADIIFSNDKTVPVVEEFVEREDGLFERKTIERTDVPIITAFDVDYFMGNLI